MTNSLKALIREASTELGSEACRNGKHQWDFEGGRACPRYQHVSCSQSVYRCSVCGCYDYGEVGGPSHHECETLCKHKGEVRL